MSLEGKTGEWVGLRSVSLFSIAEAVNQTTNILVALSSHGRAAYTAYWSKTLARTIVEWPEKKLSINDLHEETSITTDDIHNTLNAMGVLERKKKGHVINKKRVQAWAEISKVNLANPILPDAFVHETDDEDEEEEEDDEE
jgi:hypothetical protein